VGDDWVEDHHDIEVMDDSGRRLAKPACPRAMPMPRNFTMVSLDAGFASPGSSPTPTIGTVSLPAGY
jgi:hypothetical protein